MTVEECESWKSLKERLSKISMERPYAVVENAKGEKAVVWSIRKFFEICESAGALVVRFDFARKMAWIVSPRTEIPYSLSPYLRGMDT